MGGGYYVSARLISLIVGCAIAYGIGLVANLAIAGFKWPVFLVLAGLWSCTLIRVVIEELKHGQTVLMLSRYFRATLTTSDRSHDIAELSDRPSSFRR